MPSKVLMLLDNDFPPDERVEKEAVSLVRNGYDVTVLSSNFSGREELSIFKGIRVLRVNYPKRFKTKMEPFAVYFPLYQRFWVRAVDTLLKKEPFDIIHCHDLILCCIGAMMKSKYREIKYVADLHENYPSLVSKKNYMRSGLLSNFFSIDRWYKKEIEWLRDVDLIFVTASGMKRRIESKTNCNQIFVVENTINFDQVKGYNLNQTQKANDVTVLVYTGGVTYHRGLQVAIEGLSKYNSNNKSKVELWIVGSGSYESDLKKLVKERNEAQVKFLGWQSHDTMFEIINRADYALIPHLKYEHTDNTSPNKLFHYLYLGKPVLVSNCDYLVEKIEASGAGLYYEYDSPHDFSKQLKSLLEMNYLQLSSSGKTFVEQRANWNHTQKELLAGYDTL